MNIVLVSQDFYPIVGGIASHLENFITKYLAECNVHVVVPTKFISTDYSHKNYSVHFLDFDPFHIDGGARIDINCKLVNLYTQVNADAIFFGYVRSHIESGLHYKKLVSKAKLFLFAHAKEVFFVEVDPNNLDGAHKGYLSQEISLYKKWINMFDYILPVSSFTQKLLRDQGITTRSLVVPPSINAPFKISKKNSDTKLLSVGRIVKRKGFFDVLDIFPKLLESFPNLQYTIIGSGKDLAELKNKIRDLSLENCVLVKEDVSDNELEKFYADASLFVLPTKKIGKNDVEGFGIVFLEASSYGLPVIGGNSGGVVDAIVQNKSGFLINSKEELFFAISKLLSDTQLRDELGSYAFNYAKKFYVDLKSDKILRLIKDDI